MGFDMDKLSGDKKNKRNKKEVSKMIQEKSLENRVLITGFRSDIDEILSALDIFVLPSKYEGLPISTIEAQTNGLTCLVSENVPNSVNLTGHVEFLPVDADSTELWAKKIAGYKGKIRDSHAPEVVRKGHYDISMEAGKLEAIYKKMGEIENR